MNYQENIPKSPLRFLRWFCKSALIDEIEGDLIEAYQDRLEQNSRSAKLKLWKEVLQSFNLRNIGIMEKYQNRAGFGRVSMLKQYARVLYRMARKHKVYTAISIASLTLGITCAGLIHLYIQKEANFDRIYSQADKIYRINHKSTTSERSYAYAPLAMTPYLIQNSEAVVDGTRIFKYRRASPITVVASQRSFNEPRLGWADENFFELFDIPLVSGQAEGMLDRPNTIVLSETTAQKYFGEDDPIGQMVEFGSAEKHKLEVVGVFKDFPSNTSFQFDLISGLETCSRIMWSSNHLNEWRNMFVSAYLLVKPEFVQDVASFVQEATTTYFDPESTSTWESTIQPLTDIHLGAAMDIGEWSSHNDKEKLALLGAIGIIILCLGCFNFTNMITAQAGQRTKEVGVRKVLGSHRRNIAQQTLFETMTFVVVSGVLSIALIYALLPKLGVLTAHRYEWMELIKPEFYLPFVIILSVVVIISGAYPALYISRIQSIQLMKQSTLEGGGSIRNILVTAQFTITTALIISTGIVYLQLQYLKNKKLGFDDSVIVNMPIHNDEAVIPKINTFRNEIASYAGISQVTAASHEMLTDYTYITQFDIEGIEAENLWERYTVEQDYISTFDLEIIAGREFDSNIQSDSTAFILNESAIKAINLTPEEAIGKTITDISLDKTGKIVGVVRDFHFRSLHHEIAPFVMYVNWDRLDYISARLASDNFQKNISHLEDIWNKVFGDGVPFFFNYLDQQSAAMYQKEDNEMQLFSIFSFISILLGTLGLFGFVLYTTERKFKEIGLRKVLGASSWQVIELINKNFMKILIIAAAIATPITFFLMSKWLKDFAYRIDQPIWVYIATVLIIFLVAIITVSRTTWRAAASNPVEAIKNE
ncbi:ABC transporter permease [Ekhidna sp. To15]|uniref:ABC transporter permease n=1 Tax=Ekhidna sp. To15 TaxID=3395267 RepID=UPI003F51F6FB